MESRGYGEEMVFNPSAQNRFHPNRIHTEFFALFYLYRKHETKIYDDDNDND